MSFKDYNLSPETLRALTDMGFESPSDIQEKTIPLLTDLKNDFVGQAQTGTGKTAAFLIPLIEKLKSSSHNIQALIIAPTRELANQVYEEFEKISKHTKLKGTTVYGGVSYTKQIGDIKKKRPQVIVGTPGRLIDLINRGVLKLQDCTQLIIDEADEMLNMGFLEDVETIIETLSSKKSLWMFSATMPAPIKKLIDGKFNQPEYIKIAKKTLSNENITQYYTLLKRKHFIDALARVVDSDEDCFGIVFCETKRETKDLSERLLSRGYNVTSIHGDLGQSERDHSMKKFKEKKVQLLICTDVAARGIDVSNVTHVFNMSFPRQLESYVHRIGRTGRAGHKGTAISFITPEDRRKVKVIERLTKQKMEEFILPDSSVLKEIKVKKELEKMNGLKAAVVDTERDFQIDNTFSMFNEYFDDMDKEQILKIFFSYRFNKEIRLIDDSAHLTSPQFAGESSSGGGSGRSRRGGGNRQGSSRRRSPSRRGGYGASNRNGDSSRSSDDRGKRSRRRR